ncbi:hypothetical protein F5Y18DRAFT_429161 [Xylariaceae sp. FL1019]|nr:hypothetical protein F5Y18DRAFT_429161 [Xylariaceae sp. FL1019]
MADHNSQINCPDCGENFHRKESLHTHYYQAHIQANHPILHQHGEQDRGCPFCPERYVRHDKLKRHIFDDHKLPAHQEPAHHAPAPTPEQEPETVLPAPVCLDIFEACLSKILNPGLTIFNDIKKFRELLNDEGWYGRGCVTLQRLNQIEIGLRNILRGDHKMFEQLWELRLALHANGWDGSEASEDTDDEDSVTEESVTEESGTEGGGTEGGGHEDHDE